MEIKIIGVESVFSVLTSLQTFSNAPTKSKIVSRIC